MSVIPSIASDRIAILFSVSLVAAAGNTAFQSIVPSIASELSIADVWVSLATSWSALMWVILAPKWARLSDKRGRKMLMKVGVIGFALSMGLTAFSLWLGIQGYITATAAFIFFALFRGVYGIFGSAAPPAVQAYVAARTERAERPKAMALMASSLGLGTVIGPAIAHYLVFQPFGLVGPMVVFASVGLLVLISLQIRLPDDEPKYAAKGIVPSYPSSVSLPQPDIEPENASESAEQERSSARLKWRDPRISAWLFAGLLGGHAQAAMIGVIGFFVRDRLGLQDNMAEAVQAIGSVMFIGALATLLAQWGLIPLLSIRPRASVLWGALCALVGAALVAVSYDFYGIALGYAVSSLGFGLLRPGFVTGASLAVGQAEQGDVAGKNTSTAGAAYIFMPALSVALFTYWEPLAFIFMGLMLLWLLLWGMRALKD